MSLTSYRAAPPRATMCVGNCLRREAGPQNQKAGPEKSKDAAQETRCGPVEKRRKRMCVLQTWQRLTLPRLETKYHQRWSVSRPSSEWDRVQPLRHNHQVSKAHIVFEKLGFRAATSPDQVQAMGTSNENDQANRAISTGKLHALPHFHTRPINVVVFHGSQGILVFRWVSRLDAFSGYPVRI